MWIQKQNHFSWIMSSTFSSYSRSSVLSPFMFSYVRAMMLLVIVFFAEFNQCKWRGKPNNQPANIRRSTEKCKTFLLFALRPLVWTVIWNAIHGKVGNFSRVICQNAAIFLNKPWLIQEDKSNWLVKSVTSLLSWERNLYQRIWHVANRHRKSGLPTFHRITLKPISCKIIPSLWSIEILEPLIILTSWIYQK